MRVPHDLLRRFTRPSLSLKMVLQIAPMILVAMALSTAVAILMSSPG